MSFTIEAPIRSHDTQPQDNRREAAEALGLDLDLFPLTFNHFYNFKY